MTATPDPSLSHAALRLPRGGVGMRWNRSLPSWTVGFLLFAGLGACRSLAEERPNDPQGGQDVPAVVEAAAGGTGLSSERAPLPAVGAPLELTSAAAAYAATVSLPVAEAMDGHGLLNVYFLSENVISGSEPDGFAALEELRDLGVRTILSVDGKAPDVDDAASLGMRYVHVPIQYRGITDDELLRIAKTFRELEGPFYVHCFHGKHRGPAAAAVGRVVLDGADRGVAIAEMRQYSGTSTKYEGLYQVVAAGDLPTVETTEEFEYGFDPVELPEGVVGGMVQITRSFDNVVFLEGRDWEIDPSHPDLSARNEAELLAEAFENSTQLHAVLSGPQGQLEGFEEATRESRALVSAIERMQGGEASAAQEASERIDALQALCTSCHSTYRN